MSEVIVTVLEDVLVLADSRIGRHIEMYTALGASFRTVVLSAIPRDEAQRLARLHRVRYDILLTKDDSALDTRSWKLSAVREVMGMGWPIAFFLDVDPEVVREVFAMGVSTLLLSHRMLRPSWLPTGEQPRAWEDLVALRDAQDEASSHTPEVDQVGGNGGRRRWALDE